MYIMPKTNKSRSIRKTIDTKIVSRDITRKSHKSHSLLAPSASEQSESEPSASEQSAAEPSAAAMTIDVAPAAAAAADATEMPLHDTTPDFYYIKTDDVPKTGFYKRFEQIFEHAEETLENPPTIIDFLIIPQFGMKLPGGKTFSSAGEKKGLFLNSITDSIDEMYALYLTADNADKNASDDDYTLRGGVKNLKAVLTFHYDEEYHCIKIDYLCVNHLFQYKGAGTKILEYFIGMIKKYVIYYNEIHNKNFGITIRLFSLKDAVTFYIKNEFDFDDDDDKDYYGPINYDDIRSYYALINNANKDISKINKKKFKHVRKFTKNLKKGPLAVYMHKTVTSHNGRTHEGRIPTQSLEFGGGRKSRRIKPIKPIKKKTSKRGKKL